MKVVLVALVIMGSHPHGQCVGSHVARSTAGNAALVRLTAGGDGFPERGKGERDDRLSRIVRSAAQGDGVGRPPVILERPEVIADRRRVADAVERCGQPARTVVIHVVVQVDGRDSLALGDRRWTTGISQDVSRQTDSVHALDCRPITCGRVARDRRVGDGDRTGLVADAPTAAIGSGRRIARNGRVGNDLAAADVDDPTSFSARTDTPGDVARDGGVDDVVGAGTATCGDAPARAADKTAAERRVSRDSRVDQVEVRVVADTPARNSWLYCPRWWSR